jgi:hypothetical protein
MAVTLLRRKEPILPENILYETQSKWIIEVYRVGICTPQT